MREHVLLQVLFPDECSITEVTLEFLCAGVDEHVRRHMGFLGKGLLANCASIILLTFRWGKKHFTVNELINMDGCQCVE